jgi:hypothetical protein
LIHINRYLAGLPILTSLIFIDATRRSLLLLRSRESVPVMSTLLRYVAILVVAGLGGLTRTANTQSASAPVEHNGIAYITDGIGRAEVEAFGAQVRKCSLRMTFATKTGSYLSDVDGSFWSEPSRHVLRVQTHGPLPLVRLPAGRHQIEVQLRSQSATQMVQVSGSGGTEYGGSFPTRRSRQMQCDPVARDGAMIR